MLVRHVRVCVCVLRVFSFILCTSCSPKTRLPNRMLRSLAPRAAAPPPPRAAAVAPRRHAAAPAGQDHPDQIIRSTRLCSLLQGSLAKLGARGDRAVCDVLRRAPPPAARGAPLPPRAPAAAAAAAASRAAARPSPCPPASRPARAAREAAAPAKGARVRRASRELPRLAHCHRASPRAGSDAQKWAPVALGGRASERTGRGAPHL